MKPSNSPPDAIATLWLELRRRFSRRGANIAMSESGCGITITHPDGRTTTTTLDAVLQELQHREQDEEGSI